jgi:hypothetical protein
MKLTFKISEAKGLFFDSPKVIAATDAAERKVLSRFGSFVRRTARSSLRKRKKPSEPGQPPSSHAGLVKQFLFFVWDPATRKVVIGPAQLNKPDPRVLELLEKGGMAARRFRVIREEKGKGKRKRQVVKVVTSKTAQPVNVRYQPRPFMAPALEKELPKLPEMFKDSVKP